MWRGRHALRGLKLSARHATANAQQKLRTDHLHPAPESDSFSCGPTRSLLLPDISDTKTKFLIKTTLRH